MSATPTAAAAVIENGSRRWSRSMRTRATPLATTTRAPAVYVVSPKDQPVTTNSSAVASSTSG